jgi:hypothetical protein
MPGENEDGIVVVAMFIAKKHFQRRSDQRRKCMKWIYEGCSGWPEEDLDSFSFAKTVEKFPWNLF